MNVLVLGIGQSLRGDDTAGLEAVRLWREKYPQTAALVRVETSEQPGVGLLDLLQGMDAAVIVDAVRSQASAGRVVRIPPEELEAFGAEAGSTHGWGMAETLGLGRSIDPDLARCQVTLIGITGGNFGMGEGLSREVAQALPGAVKMIEDEINKLTHGDG